MAYGPDPASKARLAALLGGLITDAKDLLVHELTRAKLEVRQDMRATKRAALALGSGGGIALTGGLLWVYYSALIFFFGAEFTQVYANKYGAGVRPDEHAVAITDEAQPGAGRVPTKGKAGAGDTEAAH